MTEGRNMRMNAWYNTDLSPLLVTIAANAGNAPWTCANTNGTHIDEVCGFACSCSGNGGECLANCKQSYAANVYSKFCSLNGLLG